MRTPEKNALCHRLRLVGLLTGILAFVVSAVATAQVVPVKTVLLPIDFTIEELSASGITEPVPALTDAARTNIEAAVKEWAKTSGRFAFVDLPSIESVQQEALAENTALARRTASAACSVVRTGGKAWREKLAHFDYSIGGGLSFLADRTGADSAMLITGRDIRSTGGRKAMMVAVAAATAGYGMLSLGSSEFNVIIVNLRTGAVTWLNNEIARDIDTRTAQAATEVINEIFGDYPAGPIFDEVTPAS